MFEVGGNFRKLDKILVHTQDDDFILCKKNRNKKFVSNWILTSYQLDHHRTSEKKKGKKRKRKVEREDIPPLVFCAVVLQSQLCSDL